MLKYQAPCKLDISFTCQLNQTTRQLVYLSTVANNLSTRLLVNLFTK